MKHVIKTIPGAKDKMTALAESFKKNSPASPRRPVLLDELAKLF
jgi:hypothetical protein